MVFEPRWAETIMIGLPALAADLVGRKVDVIVTIGGTPAAMAAKNATSTIPIVVTSVSNPVGAGLVESLALPKYSSRTCGLPRVQFDGVNVYDALSATLTSPRHRKRFDRAVDRAAHRIPVATRPLLPPRSSVD